MGVLKAQLEGARVAESMLLLSPASRRSHPASPSPLAVPAWMQALGHQVASLGRSQWLPGPPKPSCLSCLDRLAMTPPRHRPKPQNAEVSQAGQKGELTTSLPRAAGSVPSFTSYSTVFLGCCLLLVSTEMIIAPPSRNCPPDAKQSDAQTHRIIPERWEHPNVHQLVSG